MMPDHTLMANAIRVLSIDAVQQANSGHPGAPMGMADMAVALWAHHLRHNPRDPNWVNRDRFVLSNGHASMLLYAVLHLSGYDLSINDLKNFRQLHSKTPGHPEVGITPGVETTTGPLGQGLANAIGMALAEKLLAREFNRPGHTVVDHHTYVFLGDGCLMEGISHEVCALAGVWKLNRLIALYDDNGISIDGQVSPWFADDTRRRFKAYGWQVLGPLNGHDVAAVSAAIASAKDSATQPTLIICKTRIGHGSPNRANSAKAHGEPLGADEVGLTRQALGWQQQAFDIPDTVYQLWNAHDSGQRLQDQWTKTFAAYQTAHPELAAEYLRRVNGQLPPQFEQWAASIAAAAEHNAQTVASRRASQLALGAFTEHLPELLGGSADLTGSNLTNTPSTPPFRVNLMAEVELSQGGSIGRHINYGVREFGMAAIMNGLALHGGYIPYGGTFLTFSDYSRNAIRMAALMHLRVIHVFTHDSIGLGEDGPTHQAVEHAASLRLIPNLDVWRPADCTETAVAWAVALRQQQRPTALLLSRQSLPHVAKPGSTLSPQAGGCDAIAHGAYIVTDPTSANGQPEFQAVLIASGSELTLALQAQTLLASHDIAVRVVSMPSSSTFDRQPIAYKRMVLPDGVPRVAIEMGVTDFWWKYAVSAVIGIDTYGASAPAGTLFKHFGFTPENVVNTVLQVLQPV